MHRKTFLLASCLLHGVQCWTSSRLAGRKRAWNLLGQHNHNLDPKDVFLDVDFEPFDESRESKGAKAGKGRFDGALYIVETDDSSDSSGVLNCNFKGLAEDIEVVITDDGSIGKERMVNGKSNGVKKEKQRVKIAQKSNGDQSEDDLDIDALENRLEELEKLADVNGKKSKNGANKQIKQKPVNVTANTSNTADAPVEPKVESWESRLKKLEKEAFAERRKEVQQKLLESRLAMVEQAIASMPREDKRVKVLESRLAKLECEISSQHNRAAVLRKSLIESNETNHVLRSEIEDLRNWDTVTVTWDIQDIEKKMANNTLNVFNSGDFWVAGYKMYLQCEISDKKDRQVGAYLMHKDGLGFFPISIAGTKFWFMGRSKVDNIVKTFGDSSAIKTKGAGLGWADFTTWNDLQDKFCIDGTVKIIAKIHVKRVTNVSVKSVDGSTAGSSPPSSSPAGSSTVDSSVSGSSARTTKSNLNPTVPEPLFGNW